MRGCSLLALVAAALQTARATNEGNSTYPPDIIIDDEWPEKFFMPGFRAQYIREQSEDLADETQGVPLETESPGQVEEINLYVDRNSTENGKNLTVAFYESDLVDKGGNSPSWLAEPRRSPWTYAAAFCLGSIFSIAFVAYNVVRHRRSKERGYERVNVADGEDPPAPPSAAQEPEAAKHSDLEAERLLLQPLLESGVSPGSTKRETRRLARSLEEDRTDGERNGLRSLWDKIVRSSRELFVPDTASSTAGRMRSSGRTGSSLPTVASRVDSLMELTDVRKTLWWRTM